MTDRLRLYLSKWCLPLPSVEPSRFCLLQTSHWPRSCPRNIIPSNIAEVQELLYKVRAFFATPCYGGMFSDLILYQADTLLFRNVNLSLGQQHELTRYPYTFAWAPLIIRRPI
jgi:hypothetical protein